MSNLRWTWRILCVWKQSPETAFRENAVNVAVVGVLEDTGL